MVPLWPPSEPVTKNAEIYGHPTIWGFQNPYFSHAALKGIVPLKSGYTPLDQTEFRGKDKRQQYIDLSNYQRLRFKGECCKRLRERVLTIAGFTTAEIHAMEALTVMSELGPCTELTNVALHPLLTKPHWENPLPKHLALFPMRNGREGYWEVSTRRGQELQECFEVCSHMQGSSPIIWEDMLPSLHLVSQVLSTPETLLW